MITASRFSFYSSDSSPLTLLRKVFKILSWQGRWTYVVFVSNSKGVRKTFWLWVFRIEVILLKKKRAANKEPVENAIMFNPKNAKNLGVPSSSTKHMSASKSLIYGNQRHFNSSSVFRNYLPMTCPTLARVYHNSTVGVNQLNDVKNQMCNIILIRHGKIAWLSWWRLQPRRSDF